MGKRKVTCASSSFSKRKTPRPAPVPSVHPLPSRRSSCRPSVGATSMALPLRFIEAPLFLTPASDSNFGNLPIISASRVSSPLSPPNTPPSPFTYSPPSLPLPLSISSKIVDPQSDPRRVPRVDELPCRPTTSSTSVKSRRTVSPATPTPALSEFVAHLSAEYAAAVARAEELQQKLAYFTALAQKGGEPGSSTGRVDNEALKGEEPHTGGADSTAGTADPTAGPTVPTVPIVDRTTADTDKDDDGELFLDVEDVFD